MVWELQTRSICKILSPPQFLRVCEKSPVMDPRARISCSWVLDQAKEHQFWPDRRSKVRWVQHRKGSGYRSWGNGNCSTLWASQLWLECLFFLSSYLHLWETRWLPRVNDISMWRIRQIRWALVSYCSVDNMHFAIVYLFIFISFFNLCLLQPSYINKSNSSTILKLNRTFRWDLVPCDISCVVLHTLSIIPFNL